MAAATYDVLDERRLRELVGQTLSIGKRAAPEAQIAVAVAAEQVGHTRFARSELAMSGDVADVRVTVRLQRDRRESVTHTNQTDAESLRRCIEGAARLLRVLPADPESQPLLGPQRYLAVSRAAACDPALERFDAAARTAAARLALDCGRAGGVELAGFLVRSVGVQALGTSTGLLALHRSADAVCTLTARTPTGGGSGWGGAQVSRRADLDVPALAQRAIDKALRSQRPQKLLPGRYTVVLEPAAVAELLAYLTDALAEREADEGRSCFARPGGGVRLGETLFPSTVTLRSDPADPAMISAPFDEEGLPRKVTTWIDGGRLAALHATRFWAQKKGRPAEGRPAAFHLLGGDQTVEGLLTGVRRGVLITRFWYTGLVDPQSLRVTGTTRDGVFLIEDGRVVAPVNNFRFNESLLNLLRSVDGLSKTAVRVPDTALRVPALRGHDFNLSAISEAV